MKRSFSLIEVLVGMTLFSLLASLLFGLYTGFARTSVHQKKQEAVLEHLIYLKTLLHKSLGQAVTKPKPYYFQQKEGTLFFTFDNGIDPDPSFSSIIKGQLYINEKDEFILEMSPLEGSQKRLHVLEKDVRNVFYDILPEKGDPLAVQVHIDDKRYSVMLDNNLMMVQLK